MAVDNGSIVDSLVTFTFDAGKTFERKCATQAIFLIGESGELPPGV